MSLRYRSLWLLAFIALSLPGFAQQRTLRICADPDNLPYSSRALSGFDNKIGASLAHDMGRRPVFVWARARRGFLREEFDKGVCDVLLGVPAGMKGVLTTAPYYRSTYVFVTRRRDHLEIASWADPQLNNKRIGLQIMEEDLSPPSLPLVRYGHATQLVGYESFGNSAGDIMRATADHRIGLAVVWGPLAGFYARNAYAGLQLTPVHPAMDAGVPFVFSMTCAVHKRDAALRDQLNAAIARETATTQRLLRSYGVPLVPLQEGGA